MKKRLRIAESKELHSTLETTIQIENKLLETMIDSGVSPSQLPDIIIAADMLYHIVTNFNSMYKYMLEDELLADLNKFKQTH